MAEQSAPTRAPETLTLTVFRLKNLTALRGENLSFMVRAEYNEKVLGESVKVECGDDGCVELNHTTTISIAFDESKDMDDLAHKPILLTVIEVLPKEKKQKEEKTLVLGQCTVDSLPMFKADTTKHKVSLTIHAVPASPIESLPPDAPKPELDVQLSVNEPLISPALAADSATMSITVESLYSLPESWQLASGQQYTYVATLPFPFTAEKDLNLVFGSGALKPGGDVEAPNKQKKWLSPGANTQGAALYIPDSYVTREAYEKEDGDYKGKEDRQHRVEAEEDRTRVVWNTERRCYLEPASCRALQDRIAKNRVLPIEIIRVPLPSSNKTKKDDDYPLSSHGVVYVDVARLLYPGVMKIKGAYKVHPFVEHEYQEKTKRKQGMADDAFKLVNNQLSRGAASPFPKKGGKEDKKAEVKKRGREAGDEASAYVKSSEPAADLDPSTDALGYATSKSYLTIEVALSRPLVPRRLPVELPKKVSTFIPQRQSFPKRTNGAEKAVTDYHGQIASVARLVLEECRELFGDLKVPRSGDDRVLTTEEKRLRLINRLSTSGKYFSFKEQLKQSVVKIVREKYLRMVKFSSSEELQAFLSELYVYLIDQMHVALDDSLVVEDAPPLPKPMTTSAQLKHFAREAEVNMDFELAGQLYRERIAHDKSSAACWFDYGTFCLHINDIGKAEECFKECVTLDRNHLHGLLLCGIVCAMEERNDAAETYLQAATSVDPKSALAWTILSLYYDGLGNDLEAEAALLEARKQAGGQGSAVTAEAAADVAPTQNGELPLSVYMQSAEWLLEVKAVTFTERTLGHELLDSLTSDDARGRVAGPDVSYYIAMARLCLQKRELETALQQATVALEKDPKNADAWSITGHLNYLLGDMEAARDCYEKTLTSALGHPSEMHSVYLRLASIYLQQGFFKEAKETFLSACKRSPSCISWLGVGIACYRLNEFSEAEDALSEANMLSNSDAEVWGYLALVCLQQGRPAEARQAYDYAQQLGLKDEELLSEISALREQLGGGTL